MDAYTYKYYTVASFAYVDYVTNYVGPPLRAPEFDRSAHVEDLRRAREDADAADARSDVALRARHLREAGVDLLDFLRNPKMFYDVLGASAVVHALNARIWTSTEIAMHLPLLSDVCGQCDVEFTRDMQLGSMSDDRFIAAGGMLYCMCASAFPATLLVDIVRTGFVGDDARLPLLEYSMHGDWIYSDGAAAYELIARCYNPQLAEYECREGNGAHYQKTVMRSAAFAFARRYAWNYRQHAQDVEERRALLRSVVAAALRRYTVCATTTSVPYVPRGAWFAMMQKFCYYRSDAIDPLRKMEMYELLWSYGVDIDGSVLRVACTSFEEDLGIIAWMARRCVAITPHDAHATVRAAVDEWTSKGMKVQPPLYNITAGEDSRERFFRRISTDDARRVIDGIMSCITRSMAVEVLDELLRRDEDFARIVHAFDGDYFLMHTILKFC